MKRYRILGVGQTDAHYRANKSSDFYADLDGKIITEKDMQGLALLKPQSYTGWLFDKWYFIDLRLREIKNNRIVK